MSAAVSTGYRTIGTTPAPAPSPPPSTAMSNLSNAATTTRDALHQLLTSPMPTLSLYTDPLNPSTSLPPLDRLRLITTNCRAWSEFTDRKAFNLPAPAEVKRRLAHNIESFFYNYVMIALVVVALHALFHPIRAGMIVGVVGLGALIYVVFPEDYRIGEGVVVNRVVKHVVMGVMVVAVLTVGRVLMLFLWIMLSVLPIVGMHAIFREHIVVESGEQV